MKNLIVILGLCVFLASVSTAEETLTKETTAAEGITSCQDEYGTFTYDHPTTGKLTLLSQAGLDFVRSEAGEPPISPAQVRECPQAKVSMVDAVKSWFKRFTEQETDEEKTKEEEKMDHTDKSGDFEAILLMTQDADSILDSSSGLQFTMVGKSVSVDLGEGIEALLLIRGCSKDPNNNCLVTADYVIQSPDGSTYQQALDTDVWKESTSSLLQYNLTNTRIGFILDSDADLGVYVVQVTVFDKLSDTELSLKGSVVAKAIPSGKNDKNQSSLEDVTSPWPETSFSEDVSVHIE